MFINYNEDLILNFDETGKFLNNFQYFILLYLYIKRNSYGQLLE